MEANGCGRWRGATGKEGAPFPEAPSSTRSVDAVTRPYVSSDIATLKIGDSCNLPGASVVFKTVADRWGVTKRNRLDRGLVTAIEDHGNRAWLKARV